MKKIFLIVVLVVLVFVNVVSAEELTETQKIELQIQQLEKQKEGLEREKRLVELNGYLQSFGCKRQLLLLKPENMVRCLCEQYGVYSTDFLGTHITHLGDINSSPKLKFSQQEFINSVANILDENGIQFINRPKQKLEAVNDLVNITPDAKEILKRWGGHIDTAKMVIDLGGKFELKIESNTISVEIISTGDDTLIITGTNNDGSKSIAICVDREIKEVSEFQ